MILFGAITFKSLVTRAVPSVSYMYSQKHDTFIISLIKHKPWPNSKVLTVFQVLWRCTQRSNMFWVFFPFLFLAVFEITFCLFWCFSTRRSRVILGQRWPYATPLQNSFWCKENLPQSLCGSCQILNWNYLSDGKFQHTQTSSVFK